MRRALARALRALAAQLAPEAAAEVVCVHGDIPESWLTPVLEALNRAAFERAWPCRDCGKLVSVAPDFVRSADPDKWAKCGPCSSVYRG